MQPLLHNAMQTLMKGLAGVQPFVLCRFKWIFGSAGRSESLAHGSAYAARCSLPFSLNFTEQFLHPVTLV